MRPPRAQEVLARLDDVACRRYVEYGVALVHAGLGDAGQVFAWLDRAVAARAHRRVWLTLDRRWNNLRPDPRFASLLGRIGCAR